MASKSGSSPCSLLDLNDDVLLEICKAVKYNGGSWDRDVKSLKALSQTNRYMRHFLLADIFQGVCIRSGEVWQRFIKEMELSEAIANVKMYIQRFSSEFTYMMHCDSPNAKLVDLYSQQSPPVSLEWLSSNLLPSRFARVLNGMIKLEKLLVVIPSNSGGLFSEAFEIEQVLMSTVRTLILGPYTGWIIPVCPQVTTISTCWEPLNYLFYWNSRDLTLARDIVASVTPAQNLQHLELNIWSVDLIERVANSMPNLTSLAAPRTSEYAGIREMLPVLSKFTKLTSLEIPTTTDLNVGFRPHGCEDAFMGPDGDAVWRQEHEDWLKVDRKVAKMVFGACTHLETLSIGCNRKANARRAENGALLEITLTDQQ